MNARRWTGGVMGTVIAVTSPSVRLRRPWPARRHRRFLRCPSGPRPRRTAIRGRGRPARQRVPTAPPVRLRRLRPEWSGSCSSRTPLPSSSCRRRSTTADSRRSSTCRCGWATVGRRPSDRWSNGRHRQRARTVMLRSFRSWIRATSLHSEIVVRSRRSSSGRWSSRTAARALARNGDGLTTRARASFDTHPGDGCEQARRPFPAVIGS